MGFFTARTKYFKIEWVDHEKKISYEIRSFQKTQVQQDVSGAERIFWGYTLTISISNIEYYKE
jgi:hypothetical protein